MSEQKDAYALDKLASHPEVLKDLRGGGGGRLLSVHLMPQNVCNQRCSFCSYRLPDNKNSEHFNESMAIPLDDMRALLDDFKEMGVLGVEVTGGGEPLAYPWSVDLWRMLFNRGFATGLVTNGTLLRDNAALINSSAKWIRVSIDSADRDTYTKMRQCSDSHYDKAWRAVTEFRDCAPSDPEFRLGTGFVLCNENMGQIYEFVKMAKEHGADNVRLTSAFSDQHLSFYEEEALLPQQVEDSIKAQQDFEDDSFKVHNLIPTRLWETDHPTQDYKWCVVKDLLCVVEGECKVYTCCTFTGTLKGLYGKFTEHPGGFKGLWEEKAEWRKSIDASKYCTVSCLYRGRNLAMNKLIESGETPSVSQVHREFI